MPQAKEPPEAGRDQERPSSRGFRGSTALTGDVWPPELWEGNVCWAPGLCHLLQQRQALCRDQPGLAPFGSDLLVSILCLTVTGGMWWNSHGLGFCFAITGQASRCLASGSRSVKWADHTRGLWHPSPIWLDSCVPLEGSGRKHRYPHPRGATPPRRLTGAPVFPSVSPPWTE